MARKLTIASMFVGSQVVAGVPNASAIELDTSDTQNLGDCVSKVTRVVLARVCWPPQFWTWQVLMEVMYAEVL